MLKPQPPPKSSALSILVVGAFLFVVIAGSIGVIWFGMDDLRENSVTIPKRKVEPSKGTTEGTIEKAGAVNSVERLPSEPTEPNASALSAKEKPVAFDKPESNSVQSAQKKQILQAMNSAPQMHEIPPIGRNISRVLADRLYSQGREFAHIGDYGRAVDCITRSHHLISNDMAKGNLYVGDEQRIAARFSALGYCFYRMNNLGPAETELTWAIGETPQNAQLYKERELIYRKHGQVELAERDAATARSIVEMTPTSKADTFESLFATSPEQFGVAKPRH
jgi:tetratricopeptide (TPR) repeat protein